MGDKYYVKDKETHMFIRLMVANYEINVDDVYEKNLDKVIEYRITELTKKNKLGAVNINRQFLPECSLLAEGNSTVGEVVAIIYGGYHIKIYDKLLGFLPNSLALKGSANLEVGEQVNVTCISLGIALEKIVLDLTKHIEFETNYQIEKAKFIANLKQGDFFLGKIVDVEGFGVFLSFGYTEALLHVTNILGEPFELPKPSRKEFYNLMETVFLKGTEIDVSIDAIAENRISLNWDVSSDRNKGLYQEIFSIYTRLKSA